MNVQLLWGVRSNNQAHQGECGVNIEVNVNVDNEGHIGIDGIDSPPPWYTSPESEDASSGCEKSENQLKICENIGVGL
jgi:hypothetical protein